MSLWADKYRPRTLSELSFHPRISKQLQVMASSGEFPHLLVYGPPGAGKKTRVLATLRELYGAGTGRLRVDVKTFILPSGRKLEFNVISSSFHLEITPSDMGNNDRIVIQDLLKEIGQIESLDFSKFENALVSLNAREQNMGKKFKVVIINEAELLTRDAQAALRRTMEKYSANIRLILICNSTSNIIDPIKSRTLPIRIASPSTSACAGVLEMILKKEHHARKAFPDDSEQRNIIYKRISDASERNLRMSIMMMEAMYMNHDVVSITTPIIRPDWIDVLHELATSICKDRSVSRLQQARSILYELMAHAIPAKLLLKKLTLIIWEFTGTLDLKNKAELRTAVISTSTIYDERLSLGSKDIFHLEGFITKVMVILEKSFMMD
ncbi:hypothetical protein KL911_001949 [Ogataea haglerorum]|uniref:uncharacterized protein n=1 Tax=Ogataea haglerorum TaxID=1937702 RepID=UPI001C8A6913|nr:uncharacterized protein KL911_001949 [Ogataea haglerorum]KAG7754510.1 hypothetical protein KL911_001949 [Ogataea haglerorum]